MTEENNSTQDITKLAIIFPQSQLHLQKGKKRYKHINACSVYFDFLQTENFFYSIASSKKTI